MAAEENEDACEYQFTLSNIRRGVTIKLVKEQLIRTFGDFEDFNSIGDVAGRAKIDASHSLQFVGSAALKQSIDVAQGEGTVIQIAKKTVQIVCFYVCNALITFTFVFLVLFNTIHKT